MLRFLAVWVFILLRLAGDIINIIEISFYPLLIVRNNSRKSTLSGPLYFHPELLPNPLVD